MYFYDPHKHHRRSMRLKDYDYSQPGAYFITLVTHNRDMLFGQVVNDLVQLSPLGEIAQEEWLKSNRLRRESCLYEDEFIVMPNHIHGIVWITVGADGVRPEEEGGACHAPQQAPQRGYQSDPQRMVGADGVRPNNGVRPGEEGGACHAPQRAPQRGYQSDPQRMVGADGVRPNDRPVQLIRLPRSLSSFVAGFKAVVTSRAGRELNMSGIWQRNYYDHIIRNEWEFANIWDYIDTNPQRWMIDRLRPAG